MSSAPLVAMIAIFLVAMRPPLGFARDGVRPSCGEKTYLLFSVAVSSSAWPVCSAKAAMSPTEPGSVATTLSTWPGPMSASDFFVFTIGSGQDRPEASNSLSKFMHVSKWSAALAQMRHARAAVPALTLASFARADVYSRNGGCWIAHTGSTGCRGSAMNVRSAATSSASGHRPTCASALAWCRIAGDVQGVGRYERAHPTRDAGAQRQGRGPAGQPPASCRRLAHAAWPQAAFETKTVADAVKALGGSAPVASGDVTITGPDIAENGAVVPVGASRPRAGREAAAAAGGEEPERAGGGVRRHRRGRSPTFKTRVKMAQTSNVYAVAMMADGRVLFAAKEIKVTLGGCGG